MSVYRLIWQRVKLTPLALVLLIFLFTTSLILSKTNRDRFVSSSSQDYNHSRLQFWIDEFYRIGAKHGTDKALIHKYHHLYGLYLGPRRLEKLSLLEIGLGCTMPYGPGRSLSAWREFLPNARISYLEYDPKCAEKFRSKLEALYIGDQSDFALLREVADGGPYDVISDDGGHTRKQQINSLIGLWPAVKSGGIYVMEDVFFWNDENYNDAPVNAMDMIVKLIYLLVDKKEARIVPPTDIFQSLEFKAILKELLSINCFYRACVFVKK